MQQSEHAAVAEVVINPADAERLGLTEGQSVIVSQNTVSRTMPATLSDALPLGSVWVAAGIEGSEGLGALTGPITLRPSTEGSA